MPLVEGHYVECEVDGREEWRPIVATEQDVLKAGPTIGAGFVEQPRTRVVPLLNDNEILDRTMDGKIIISRIS